VSSSKRSSSFKRSTLNSLKNIFGHSSRSETSLGEEDSNELEKLKIIEVKVEEYRTLLFIDEKDRRLYEDISQWVKENEEDKKIIDTISKFGE
jgi:hypothetical protein